MRKRIVIGVLAIIVVGVLAFVLSQPKKGTVEWHKREYIAIADGRHVVEDYRGTGEYMYLGDTQTWRHCLRNTWCKLRRKWEPQHQLTNPEIEEIERQEKALIELGYLERRKFVVTGRFYTGGIVLAQSAFTAIPKGHIWRVSAGAFPNVVYVVAMREDMPKWEELVENATVPEAN